MKKRAQGCPVGRTVSSLQEEGLGISAWRKLVDEGGTLKEGELFSLYFVAR